MCTEIRSLTETILEKGASAVLISITSSVSETHTESKPAKLFLFKTGGRYVN